MSHVNDINNKEEDEEDEEEYNWFCEDISTRLGRALSDEEWDRVLRLLTKKNSSTFEATRIGMANNGGGGYEESLLHLAVKCNPPSVVIKKILDLNPLAARVPDEDAMDFPIHFAPGGCSDVGIIKLLLKAHPKGVRMKNSVNDLPLHIAVRPTLSDSLTYNVINELVMAYPGGLNEENKYGWTPLSLALKTLGEKEFYLDFAPIDLIQMFVTACPECVRKPDGEGQIAIHNALLWNLSEDVIQLLINAFPEGLHHRDNNGQLPIHNACITNGYNMEDKLSIITMLLSAHPESVIEACTYGEEDSLLFPKELIMQGSTSSSTSSLSSELLALLDRYEKMYIVYLAHNHNLPVNEETNNETIRKRSHNEIMTTMSNNGSKKGYTMAAQWLRNVKQKCSFF